MEDNYKSNVQKYQFETPKRCSFKNSDKIQGNEINITQNRYEVLSDSDERVQRDTIMIMTNYLTMSRQAYHHGK